MIRLLYFCDSHIRGTNPRARVDDYPEALKMKLREVFYLAAKHSCDAIICGGDLFDRPDTAYAVAGEFAAVLAECPVQIYVCPGNHEIYGYNLDTLNRSVLGFLDQINLVQILSREPVVLRNQVTVYLTGQGFYHDIDRSPADYQTGVSRIDGFKVHVVHGMLVEKPLPYEVAHTLISQVKTDAHVILGAHEHIGFGLRRRNDGVWFCNPGALSRTTAKAEEFYRPIQVALFEFSLGGIKAELIGLSCAQPGTEVLSRDHLAQLAEREERMNHFLSLLVAEGESKFLEIREIVDDITWRESIPAAVRDEALRRLGTARETKKIA
jgi:DNA repair exonuclease SbcCD nuclease subunit